MQVQSIRNYSYYPSQNKLDNTKKRTPQSFGSIFADANRMNMNQYAILTMLDPLFRKMKGSSTRILRELSSELAIAKLLNPNEISEVKILGSSDGSEAWGYAIAIKEAMGIRARNVNIKGIDIEPGLTDLAKTDCIVMSSVERDYAEGKGMLSRDRSPLKGLGWNKYLTKTERPEEFNEILERYPYTIYLEKDPAVNKKIGQGLEWYRINKNGLPKVEFECADMRNSLAPSEHTDNQIYVLANSSGYIYQKNPDEFFTLFKKIKELNKDKKNVYVVLGSVEEFIFNNSITGMLARNTLHSIGFKNIPTIRLEKLGIAGKEDASAKIYELVK